VEVVQFRDAASGAAGHNLAISRAEIWEDALQVQSNQGKKCYEINYPSADYPEPDWSSTLGDPRVAGYLTAG